MSFYIFLAFYFTPLLLLVCCFCRSVSTSFQKKESCPPHLPSCILPLLYERATVHQPQQPVHSLDPPRLPSCVPSLRHRVTRITSLRAASPQSPVPSYPPPGQQRIYIPGSYLQPTSTSSCLMRSALVQRAWYTSLSTVQLQLAHPGPLRSVQPTQNPQIYLLKFRKTHSCKCIGRRVRCE